MPNLFSLLRENRVCRVRFTTVMVCLGLVSLLVVSDLLPIGCLVVVGDQAYHCCVIGKFNGGVGVVPGCAVMSVRLR